MKVGNGKNEAGEQFLTEVADATQSASGLMSAADKAKLDGITSGICCPEEIENNSDLNNIISSGVYQMGSNTGAQTLLNCPVQVAFSLIVLTPTHLCVRQFLYEYNAKTVFIRTKSENGSWSNWSKILNSENLTETFGSSGYFKLPGGTIVQYGLAATSSNSVNTTVTLPVAYPNQISSIVASCGLSHVVAVARDGSLSTIRLTTETPLDGAIINWMTVGY